MKSISFRDFPSGPVVKNPPSSAADAGSIPGRGTKIPRAAGQLSPRATTTELVCLHERAREPQTTERKPSRHNWREARMPQRERNPSRPRTVTKRSLMPQQRSHVPQIRRDAAKK